MEQETEAVAMDDGVTAHVKMRMIRSATSWRSEASRTVVRCAMLGGSTPEHQGKEKRRRSRREA